MSLHDFLAEIKTAVDTDETASHTRALVRAVLDEMPTEGDHGEMWNTARQSLGYVLDVAVNQGTAEDLQELEELIERDTDGYRAQIETDQAAILIGQLYIHNYAPEDFEASETPLDDVIDAWAIEVGDKAMQAVLEYVSENWDEDED